ncbi:GNAT family N-acetyltransferase [Fusibacter bizertensis]
MNSGLFHVLEGENVYFKALSLDDVQEIHHYASDKEVKRFIGWNLMHNLDETFNHVDLMIKRELAGTHLYASVVLKSNHLIIGTVMLFDFDEVSELAEIGYVFHRDFWGKGYGTESIALITEFAFDSLKLHKIKANVVDINIGSIKLLEKNGYQLEGREKNKSFIEGNYYDLLHFAKVNLKV